MSDLPTTLDGITALTDAATPGPWEVDRDPLEAWPDFHRVLSKPEGIYLAGVGRAGYAGFDRTDAEFIAHARTLVPRLVEALRWLDDVGLWCEGDTSDIRPTIARILAGGQP